ncbi:MAG: signal recognition particle-docking protein FtsY [Thiohalocapsa sp.]|jgi:fused signal recognition particle receptor|uniref:signal recognition particle-docking protein FtsY n=1 Tax=Thiohalocapsa sp. TaxID=2497641 RepID=UPI0025ED3858|nr:signal recognition particle-docking protein FtsY [Thiohalocapsa sp.]MCG6942321.1 signal recognition particle-docking protein FtsY [Thiohalocapsa sp.]
MFGFGKKKRKVEPEVDAADAPAALPPQEPAPAPPAPPAPAPKAKAPKAPKAPPPRPAPSADTPAGEPPSGRLAQAIAERAAGEQMEARRGLFAGLRNGLARTREVLNADIAELVTGRKEIDEDLLEELEMLLVAGDVGVPATTRIIEDLAYRVKLREVSDPKGLLEAVRKQLAEILRNADAPVRQPAPGRPQVILMVGVNGVGKTTTIGKLTKQLQAEGNKVMLAAGDTFRAAAVEQLQAWGERNDVPVIAQHAGADPASVIYDALQAATARGFDVLIADTAGRLHTKINLMEELKKIVRVMQKIDPDAPHEVMLVVDATTGQNALHQAVQFNEAVPLTGITLTKLDGTAKGGILFAIAERLQVPFRFIGVGEKIEDLRHFEADVFLDALMSS